MLVPGLDELEMSIGRAVDALARLREENSELKAGMAALGKELDNLAAQMESVGAGQKMDSRKKKRIEQKLRSIADRLA